MEPTKISDYEQLSEIAASFSEGKLDRLLVVGTPGLFKTETIRRSMKSGYLYLRGRSSPISLYEELCRGIGRPVVIDDCEVMMGDKNAQEILRDLLETSDVKTIAWRTQSHVLKDKKLPNSFTTISPCCIIANGIGKGRVWDAILSRVKFFHFEPTWEQVLDYMENWFPDKEILDLARSHQQELGIPDGRRLVNAADLKNASLKNVDWQNHLLAELTPSRKGIQEENEALDTLRTLLLDDSLQPKERVELFCEKTKRSRATFFRYQKKWSEEGLVSGRATNACEAASGCSLKYSVIEGGDPVVASPMNAVEHREATKTEKIKLRLKPVLVQSEPETVTTTKSKKKEGDKIII